MSRWRGFQVAWCGALALACLASAAVTLEEEPPLPVPVPEVQALLEEGRAVLASDPGSALELGDQALEAARRDEDEAGEAMAQELRARALEKLERRAEAATAWLAAEMPWGRQGLTPGRVEGMARAGLLAEAAGEEGADQLLDRALELAARESSRPGATADALLRVARAAYHADRQGTMLRLGGAALDLLRARRPGSQQLADALLSVATMEWHSDLLAPMRGHLLEALSIEESVDPRAERVARLLVNLGNAETMLSLWEEGEAHYLRSMEIRRGLGADARLVGEALPGLGMLEAGRGDLEAARGYFAEAVRIEEEYGQDPVELARMLINLAWVPIELQQYAEARRINERALALLEEHAPDHPARAKVLCNIAEVTLRQGDVGVAERRATEALKAWEKVDPGSLDESLTLTALGNVATFKKQPAEAEGFHLRALDIRERLVPGSPWVGESLHFLADAQLDLGRVEDAEVNERRALQLLGGMEECSEMTQAEAITTMGLIARERGDLGESKRLLELAAGWWQSYGGASHPGRRRVLVHLSGTCAAQGELRLAMDAALEADRAAREHGRLTAGSLPEREGVAYVEDRAARDVVVSLATGPLGRDGAATRQAWDAVVRGRALVLDEVAARNEAVRFADDPAISERFEALRSAREGLARVVVRGRGQTGAEAFQAELEAATAARERAEMELAAASAEYRRGLEVNRAGVDEVLGAVPAGHALIAFAQYGQVDLERIGHDWEDRATRRYAAFVLPPGDAPPSVVRLGEGPEVDAAVDEVRRQIASAAAAGWRASARMEAAYRDSAAVLRRLVWDPVEPLVRQARRVLVVPDGSLGLVDLATLPHGESGYLVEAAPPIHYLSAERDLVGRKRAASTGRLLAVGNPDFDERRVFAAFREVGPTALAETPVRVAEVRVFRGHRSGCSSFQDLRFEGLPASAGEVAEVADLWRGARGGRVRGPSPGAGVTTLSGREATEGAFKRQAPGDRVLHLATHGFFLGGDCARSDTGVDADTDAWAADNPLLLSGLALAGANHRDAAGPDEEDGILTAEEIASLDLSGVEWAVLSACDTGLGEVKTGEGVFGLRRAFQVAGARTLIMSLWPVDDEVTRAWMRALYTNRFAEGMSTVDAVHGASLALLRDRREKGLGTHPVHWAGFIASGDWR